MRWIAAWLAFWVAGCTTSGRLGCEAGHQVPRLALAPPVEIELQRIGECSFRVVGEIPHHERSWLSVHVDEFSTPSEYWTLDAGILRTAPGSYYCDPDAGVPHTLELIYYREVSVGGE